MAARDLSRQSQKHSFEWSCWWVTSLKTACNRYGSNSGFERAKSRGFEQKAVSTVRVPHQRGTFFKNAESFGRKNSIRSTAYKQAFEGLKY
jgi:hypothetical protein